MSLPGQALPVATGNVRSSEAMNGQSVRGMTVNERLYQFGLADRFDAAARSGDVSAMTLVLLEAQFSEEQVAQTANAVGANPGRYGY